MSNMSGTAYDRAKGREHSDANAPLDVAPKRSCVPLTQRGKWEVFSANTRHLDYTERTSQATSQANSWSLSSSHRLKVSLL